MLNLTRKQYNEIKGNIENMPENTKAQKARKELALRYLDNTKDDGRIGRIKELLNAYDGSKKIGVSKQGKADNFIRLFDGTKTVNKAVESKSNGGRIGNILNALNKGKNGIVIYDIDICNSSTGNIRRHTDKKIMSYSTLSRVL